MGDRRGRVALVVVGGMASVAYVMTLFVGWRPAAVQWAHEIVPIVVPLAAAFACFRAARQPMVASRTWILMGVGALGWALGDIGFTIVDLVGLEPSPLSVADFGYLSLIPAWTLALLSHPARPRRGLELAGAGIDALTIFVAAAAAMTRFVLVPIAQSGLTAPEKAVTLTYPTADLVLLGAFVLLLARRRIALWSVENFIGMAVVVLLVGDSIYAVQQIDDAYVTGSPVDLTWIFTFGVVAYAAHALSGARIGRARTPGANAVAVAGMVAVAGLVTSAAVVDDNAILLAGAAVAALLVGLRWMVFIAENARLFRSLQDSLRAAEAAAQGKEEFVAEASHQLRTPLTSIRLRLEEIPQLEPSDPLVDEYLAEASQEVDRLHHLTERLLGLLSHGALPERKARVDVASVVHEATDRVAPLAHARDVSIEADVREEVWILSRPGALDEVVMNLVDNAVKHSPEGGTVRVCVDRQGDRACVAIDDDGPGMDPNTRQRAFDPFYRADPRKRGFGLGLSIAKRICDAGGAELILAAGEGRGTRASILWPLADFGQRQEAQDSIASRTVDSVTAPAD